MLGLDTYGGTLHDFAPSISVILRGFHGPQVQGLAISSLLALRFTLARGIGEHNIVA